MRWFWRNFGMIGVTGALMVFALLAKGAIGLVRGPELYGLSPTGYAPLVAAASQSSHPGPVQVVDYYYYGCPHCTAFEPTLEKWIANEGDAIQVRRIPVTGGRPDLEQEAAIFYALDRMGAVNRLQNAVFQSISGLHNALDSDEKLRAWARANGLDADTFLAAVHSPDTMTRVRAGQAEFSSHKLVAVPTIVIGNQWVVSPDTVGSQEGMPRVMSDLVRKLNG
ncbi:thiol:disulfide interchange protein DsbA/DsbL [Paraburkholderia sp. J8-2]|uniref:thiol:disulfide interchange protein DsbA/DsbL n=1 Tax=Paraburkholderia sp. J8-2 TaxID=2805440 RepID=UPI002AB6230D|nr:thiol:disulfide interchange protein DsbA/DsbL [Paraburkholderia sp. J8-2]